MDLPSLTVLLILALSGWQEPGGDAPTEPTIADVITLADGSVLLGQVDQVGRQGELLIMARRAWVVAKLPDQAKSWAREELERVRLARALRRERLYQWRDDRKRGGTSGGPIGVWIDRDFRRVAEVAAPRTPLMDVILDRSDVKKVERRGQGSARLLRLAWKAGIDDPEDLTEEEARAELGPRVEVPDDAPVSMETLLPIRPESDARWQLRRAATEASLDASLRFVRFRWFLLPEVGSGPDLVPPDTRTSLLDNPDTLTAFGSIQAVRPADPVQLRLGELGTSGNSGAIVSVVEFATSSDSATATSALWVRDPRTGWSSTRSRSATARLDEPAEPDEPIAASTPIRSALFTYEMVASTPSAPSVSQRRQAAGLAAQRALGRARVALDRDLVVLVLPFGDERGR